MTWIIEQSRGAASAFHARPLPDPPTRALWWFTVDRPAIVLGSTQPEATIDGAAAADRGVEVVRRRSGGGAVLLVPDEAMWADVLVPAGDHLWDDDIGRSAWWLGDAWAAALAACGVAGAAVHRGPLVRSPWSSVVCFAGLGPGEVTLGQRKVVGVSQRRTRSVTRFQCALHRRWDPAALASLLAEPRPGVDELAAMAADVAAAPDGVFAALAEALPG